MVLENRKVKELC